MQLVDQDEELSVVILAQSPDVQSENADYLAIMCHEIGTPLGAIIGLSRILATVECSPERKKECADMLLASSDMLMQLLKNMLDSSKLDAGRMEIELTCFSLAKVIEEAVQIITRKVEEKGLELEVHISNEMPMELIGDPLRIRQILLNLLTNAIKFTEVGKILLYVNADSYSSHTYCPVTITVADSGIGMSSAEMEKIFDKYVQAGASISRKYGGTGLGLSICRDLVQLMQGDIAVKSSPEMGSRFTVTLPLRKATELLAVA